MTPQQARRARVTIMTRYLYDRMPGHEPVECCPASGQRMWGEVEGNDHYTFCEAVAELIERADSKTHVQPD